MESQLNRCINTVKALRDPESGCPWDKEQTHKSLLKYLIEESYEFIAAVEDDVAGPMEEELGDVLFQVLLHAQIAEENKLFNLESVAGLLADKLIRRHPHVFEKPKSVITSNEVITQWQQIKEQEKKKSDYFLNEKLLQSPALESAYNIGKKSREVQFDWNTTREVLAKVEEEWIELQEEHPADENANLKRVEEELGDLFFSLAQLARHLHINPEECLRKANKKFISRFNRVEELTKLHSIPLDQATTQPLEKFWNQVKKNDQT